MRSTVFFILLFSCGSLLSQESSKSPGVKHENHLKIGFSNQIDLFFNTYYDSYYYNDYYYRDGGVNFQLFLAYEHVWAFANSTAIGLEPKIGAAFRPYNTDGFVGPRYGPRHGAFHPPHDCHPCECSGPSHDASGTGLSRQPEHAGDRQ